MFCAEDGIYVVPFGLCGQGLVKIPSRKGGPSGRCRLRPGQGSAAVPSLGTSTMPPVVVPSRCGARRGCRVGVPGARRGGRPTEASRTDFYHARGRTWARAPGARRWPLDLPAAGSLPAFEVSPASCSKPTSRRGPPRGWTSIGRRSPARCSTVRRAPGSPQTFQDARIGPTWHLAQCAPRPPCHGPDDGAGPPSPRCSSPDGR